MRTSAMLRCVAAIGAMTLLASCSRPEIDIEAITQSYRSRISQMPATSTPRMARPTGRPASQPLETGLESRQPRSGIVMLSLEDALHRALVNSLDIRIESYSPGIADMDVRTAEAAFDAVFFVDLQHSNLDDPVNSTAGGGRSKSWSADAGVKKQLITGGQVSVQYQAQRSISDQILQKFPGWHYQNQAAVAFNQPLLRNFGVDVNSAQIRVNTNKRDISVYEFRRQVIDTLAKVEQAYWTLYFTRQSLAIGQDLLARTERTYALVVQRLQWDALPVNVSQAHSAVASRRATVIRDANSVKDAEDDLKTLLNDPQLPLHSDIAILPTDDPMTAEVPLDTQQELLEGLDSRPELQEAKLNISNANIIRQVAENQLLPKLDFEASWNLSGLDDGFPDSNRQVFQGRFQDYVVGFKYEFPLGNRGAIALVKKTKLQQEQAADTYRSAANTVTTQILKAVRDVQTGYREIVADKEAAQAATENLAALVARREKLSPEYLQLELQTQESQATARRQLLSVVANYNIAIVRLEQAKGTLLKYNRVELGPDGTMDSGQR